MGRWGDGEMGRWGDGEMGRWGDGEMGQIFIKGNVSIQLSAISYQPSAISYQRSGEGQGIWVIADS
ncbi:MAG: hypothetical protein F6K26_35725 [Moorea sp. SIO2I5]|nr:hypothetical protein [Moorena sp. SIO2I5]